MEINIYKGAAVQQWLETTANHIAWNRLYARCPWATPYQSPEFANIWFRHYASIWEPLLLIAIDEEQNLQGLLPLARKGHEIVGVGAHQAEYQGWLCNEVDIEQFLDGALDTLFKVWPAAHLRLRYVDVTVASGRFLAWARTHENVALDFHYRPMMVVDSDTIDKALRKSSNRSKLNRLKKSGELVFKYDHLESDTTNSFNEIIHLYDFRQGAVNSSCPFSEDKYKKAFHLELLKKVPDHFVVFRVLLNEQTIAALLGVRGPRRISNSIIAYSPHYSRQSPGKLLIYLAAQSMLDDEVEYLDLTAGGDPWKERFATDHDKVYELNVWRDKSEVRKINRYTQLYSIVKNTLTIIRIPPHKIRKWVARVRRIRPKSAMNLLSKILPYRIEYRIYKLHLDDLLILPTSPTESRADCRINNLADLVKFKPTTSWQNKTQFLSSALGRFEDDERVYTVSDNNLLLHYGWMIRKQSKAYFTEVSAEYSYPEPGAVLYDFQTHPNARGKGLYQQTVMRMLQDLKQEATVDGGSRHVYISALANNKASCHVIEKLGFKYIESIIRTGFLGVTRLIAPIPIQKS